MNLATFQAVFHSPDRLGQVDVIHRGLAVVAGPIILPAGYFELAISVGRFSISTLASKEYKIALSDLQRRALLRLLGETEARLNFKEVLPDHAERAGVYKAMKKLRNALPRRAK